ncbi:unnamed protein product, partial [Ectocarpus sp. 12 AP-2014]
MWLASPFSYLCSAAATTLSTAFAVPPSYSSLSLANVRHLSTATTTIITSSLPRVLAATGGGSRRRPLLVVLNSSSSRTFRLRASSTVSPPSAAAAVGRRPFVSSAVSYASGDSITSGMVPDDAAALIRAVYDSKPTPQVCVSTAGAGGQAISWLLGVPGAS